MIKLLIFDLDGTLVDTIRDITDAVNYAVRPFDAKSHTTEDVKSMVGAGIANLISGLIHPQKNSKEKTQQSKEEAIKRFISYYSEHLLDNTIPYPQVEDTLSKLTGYRKAVISNKREHLSREVLEGVGISRYFDVILGSDSIPEKKPSPIPVYEVLKRLEFPKERAVMIGDSNFDIEAGKRAGVKTVAVTYGYRDRDILKDADYMIDSFGELLDLLPKI
jgi:phosphoglycolate phosphatase